MQLRQVAADRQPDIGKHLGNHPCQIHNPKGGFMNHRNLHSLPDLLQLFPQILLFPRQEAVKRELPGIKAAGGNRRDSGRTSGHRNDRDSPADAGGRHLVPGVGDAGGSRVRHQRGLQVFRKDLLRQLVGLSLFVVPVAADHPGAEGKDLPQLHRHPGVLRDDQIRRLQRFNPAGGEIPQIADRRCHHV